MSEEQEVKRVPKFPEDLVNETMAVLSDTDIEHVKKGANEVTKAITRTQREDENYPTVKLVIIAEDVSPPEITYHLPNQAREANIPFVVVPSQDKLGEAINIRRTACVAIFDASGFEKVIENASEIVGLNE